MAWDSGTIVAFVLTLMVYSYVLYKETPLFKFAVYTFLGAAIGNSLIMATTFLKQSTIDQIAAGSYITLIPLILGVLVFSRLTNAYKDLSRWGTAVLVGSGGGVAITAAAHTSYARNLLSTINPFLTSKDAYTWISNLVLFTAIVTVVFYFQFTSYFDKPAFNYIRRVGRIFLMIAFGAQFGSVVLTRLATLSGRIYFLVQTLGLAA
jgi:hypothetical protein